MKKFLSIATLVSALHFVEDAALVALGRYTEVSFFILLIGTIIFGVVLAFIARHRLIKQWLGK